MPPPNNPTHRYNLTPLKYRAARCKKNLIFHGTFHPPAYKIDGSGMRDTSNVWFRHPSNFIIPNAGEYAGYQRNNPLVPVAKLALDVLRNSPDVVPGTDIVTCISCHRAHGPPNPGMLRGNDTSCEIGSENAECGCFSCHPGKDQTINSGETPCSLPSATH